VSVSVSASPSALRTLVAGVVDYAGLFPPASLDMPTAVANFAEYRASDDAWMLGRFVVPVSRLPQWEAAVTALPEALRDAWTGARISALLSGEYAAEAEYITDFNANAPFGVRIDVVEGRTATPDDVLALAAAVPDGVLLYCEIPHREDPLAHLQAAHTAGVRAKIRTGGVTLDVFPTPDEIVRFLRRCVERGVTVKATAGLHHPVRGEFRLTYAPDSIHGTMFGYLNVFLCAAAMYSGFSDALARAVLLVTDASAIDATAEFVRVTLPAPVEGVSVVKVTHAVLEQFRQTGMAAFGSCSFREPVQELAPLFGASAS
jgi:hypothetical protein